MGHPPDRCTEEHNNNIWVAKTTPSPPFPVDDGAPPMCGQAVKEVTEPQTTPKSYVRRRAAAANVSLLPITPLARQLELQTFSHDPRPHARAFVHGRVGAHTASPRPDLFAGKRSLPEEGVIALQRFTLTMVLQITSRSVSCRKEHAAEATGPEKAGLVNREGWAAIARVSEH